MKKTTFRQDEKGVIIVEIIAVIALLGVMGPLLFRQVQSRNQEVDNVNIATEVRTLKDGLSAFIMANREGLETRISEDACSRLNGGIGPYSIHDLEGFLPLSAVVPAYDFQICNIGGYIHGFVVPTEEVLPERSIMRRSARIANLIGADGAICQGEHLNGVAGSWRFDRAPFCQGRNGIYVASTGMDTYIPEVSFEDYSASLVNMPEKVGFKELGSKGYFSAGGGEDCFTIHHDTSLGGVQRDDEIVKYGEGMSSCRPLFWVGLDGDDNVYAKSGVKIGDLGSSKGYGIELLSDTSAATAESKIIVRDTDGAERITIDDSGKIIARGSSDMDDSVTIDGSKGSVLMKTTTPKGEVEQLEISGQKIVSDRDALNVKVKEGDSATAVKYKLDPAGISVVKDIRIDDFHGVKLSEIMPSYITRGIKECTSSCEFDEEEVRCPVGYAFSFYAYPVYLDRRLNVSNIAKKLKVEDNDSDGITISATSADAIIKLDRKVFEDANVGYNYDPENRRVTFSVITSDYDDEDEEIREFKFIVQSFCVLDNTGAMGVISDSDEVDRSSF